MFKVDASGNETILHTFTGELDGAYPSLGVTRDQAGNLYGTTSVGGRTGSGLVYMLNPAGRETILHEFGGTGDGAYPSSGVILDAKGNLYGTTSLRRGGRGGCGV